MGSPRTFEMNLTQKRKGKSIALKSIQEELKNMNLEESGDDFDQLALLIENFTKFVKKMRKQSKVDPRPSKCNDFPKPNISLNK